MPKNATRTRTSTRTTLLIAAATFMLGGLAFAGFSDIQKKIQTGQYANVYSSCYSSTYSYTYTRAYTWVYTQIYAWLYQPVYSISYTNVYTPTYTYTLSPVDILNENKTLSDYLPCVAISGFKAAGLNVYGKHGMTFNWNAEPSASSYEITRTKLPFGKSPEKPVIISNLPDTSYTAKLVNGKLVKEFTDNTIEAYTTYTYIIRYMDYKGRYSPAAGTGLIMVPPSYK